MCSVNRVHICHFPPCSLHLTLLNNTNRSHSPINPTALLEQVQQQRCRPWSFQNAKTASNSKMIARFNCRSAHQRVWFHQILCTSNSSAVSSRAGWFTWIDSDVPFEPNAKQWRRFLPVLPLNSMAPYNVPPALPPQVLTTVRPNALSGRTEVWVLVSATCPLPIQDSHAIHSQSALLTSCSLEIPSLPFEFLNVSTTSVC